MKLFLKSLSHTIFSQLLVALIGLFILSFLSHKLSKEEIGLFLVIRRISTFCIPIFSLNLGLSLAKFSHNENFNSINNFSDSIKIILIFNFLLLLPIYYLSDNIQIYIFNSLNYNFEFYALIIFLLVNIFHNLVYNYFRGKQDYKLMNFINIIFGLSGIISLIFLILPINIGNNYVSYFYFLYSFILFSFDFLFIIKSLYFNNIIHNSKPKKTKINKIFLKYGISRIPSGLFIALIFTMPILINSNLESAASIGIVLSLCKIIQMLVFPFNVILVPEISKLVKNNHDIEINKYIQFSFEIIFSLLFLIGISLYFFIPELIIIAFGENYTSIISPLKIILPFIGIYLGYIILRGIIDGLYNKPYINIINSVSAGTLFLLIYFAKTSVYWIVISFGFSIVLLGINSILFLIYNTKVVFFNKNIICSILLNIVCFLIFYILSEINLNISIYNILILKFIIWSTILFLSILFYKYLNISWYKELTLKNIVS
ncbi:MAG: hypothetical protein CMF96_04615 [Candidatus Marinimicrobia bacterium]|nr:hypothetical protein [Candidatus Neomarinimicrobiota bacterium]